jgi:hypothetical protein
VCCYQAAVAELARECSRPLPERDGIKPTELFARNCDVDNVNARELEVWPHSLTERGRLGTRCSASACLLLGVAAVKEGFLRLSATPAACDWCMLAFKEGVLRFVPA